MTNKRGDDHEDRQDFKTHFLLDLLGGNGVSKLKVVDGKIIDRANMEAFLTDLGTGTWARGGGACGWDLQVECINEEHWHIVSKALEDNFADRLTDGSLYFVKEARDIYEPDDDTGIAPVVRRIKYYVGNRHRSSCLQEKQKEGPPGE